MLTFTRQTFDLPDGGDHFLTHIKLDCERTTFSFGDVFRTARFNVEYDKPWIGEVKGNDFRIIRTIRGIFIQGVSNIVIRGQILDQDKVQTMTVQIGLADYALFNFAWSSIALTSFIGLTTHDTFWTVLSATVILTIRIFLMVVDKNNTENEFNDYFERTKAASHNTVHTG